MHLHVRETCLSLSPASNGEHVKHITPLIRRMMSDNDVSGPQYSPCPNACTNHSPYIPSANVVARRRVRTDQSTSSTLTCLLTALARLCDFGEKTVWWNVCNDHVPVSHDVLSLLLADMKTYIAVAFWLLSVAVSTHLNTCYLYNEMMYLVLWS